MRHVSVFPGVVSRPQSVGRLGGNGGYFADSVLAVGAVRGVRSCYSAEDGVEWDVSRPQLG
jgi:hypothetical protein